MATYGATRWTNSSGTMNDTHQTKRLFVVQFVDMHSTSEDVWWTDDGTRDGTSLYSSSLMPYVKVMLAASGNERDWNEGFRPGPMLRSGNLSSLIVCSHETQWDSGASVWRTRIFHKGDPEYSSGSVRSGGEDDRPFTAMAAAWGLG